MTANHSSITFARSDGTEARRFDVIAQGGVLYVNQPIAPEDITTTELDDIMSSAETGIASSIASQFSGFNTVRSVYALQPGSLWEVVLQRVQGGRELETRSFYVTKVGALYRVTTATIDALSAAASIAASFGGTAGLSVSGAVPSPSTSSTPARSPASPAPRSRRAAPSTSPPRTRAPSTP